jgi:hypothetical protein
LSAAAPDDDDEPTTFAERSEVGGGVEQEAFDQAPDGARTYSDLQPLPRERLLKIVAVGCVAALLLGAGAGYLYLRAKRSAPPASVVHVLSRPEGADVVFNGKALGEQTPCLLPAVPEGEYPLLLSKRGYQDYRSMVSIPETGTLTLPLFELEPKAGEKPKQPTAVGKPLEDNAPAPGPPAEVEVELKLTSIPPGAILRVNGEDVGAAPQTVEAKSGETLNVRAALKGHLELERRIRVTQTGTEQAETLRLEPARPAKLPSAPASALREAKAMGKVRFAVTPWADVSCGPHRFGQTPFADQQLPVGTYECTFVNPDHGTRIQKVEVKPNTLAKVTVRF